MNVLCRNGSMCSKVNRWKPGEKKALCNKHQALFTCRVLPDSKEQSKFVDPKMQWNQWTVNESQRWRSRQVCLLFVAFSWTLGCRVKDLPWSGKPMSRCEVTNNTNTPSKHTVSEVRTATRTTIVVFLITGILRKIPCLSM